MRLQELHAGRVRRLPEEENSLSLAHGWCWIPPGLGRYRFEVVEPFRLRVLDEMGFPREVTVKRGFKTDGATCAPDFGSAHVFHDHLYRYKSFEDGSPCSRREADEIMTLVLRREGYRVWAALFSTATSCNPCCVFTFAWKAQVDDQEVLLD